MVNSTLLNSPVKAGVFLKRLLAVFLATSSFFSVYAHPLQGGEEKVTIKEKDVPLRAVFKLIRKQTGYNFFYTQAYVNDERKVTLDVKGASVDNVLQRLLGGEYEWVYNEEAVSIRKKKLEEKATDAVDTVKENNGNLFIVAGKITDINGSPVPGATILIKGTNNGTNADENGEFALPGVKLNTSLIISSIGYEKREVVVRGRSLMTKLNINVNDLDVAVVQGYGTTTRRLTTSNIARVTAEEIERQPVINPLLALQGRVPGLEIKQTNGFASAPLKIELRGRNAINPAFTSDPLYIIDGVPLTVLEVGGASGYVQGSKGFLQSGFNGPANGQSPFFNINPSDIASIEVLKDADATAIYGSRGANGVILITTKKGKAGATKFDLHVQRGITKQTRFWDMMNTQQYLQMRREGIKNSGFLQYLTPAYANSFPDLLVWDTTKYTDWQKVLYGGMGESYDAQGSLSGGNNQTNFRIGAGYNHTTNILSITGADQRASLSVSIGHRSPNQRLEVSITTSYTYTQSDMVDLPAAVMLPPNAPAMYDSVGNLNYEGWGGPNTGARSYYPFAALKRPYTAKTNFLNSNLNISYEVVKGMRFSTSFGYNNTQANNRQFNLIASKDPMTNPTGDNSFGYNNNNNWIMEPQFNYDFSIRKGKISVLLGASLQQANTSGIYMSGTGYTSDALIGSLSNALSKEISDQIGEYKYAAAFGRITYNLQNRYILNVNARRDGSSRFGEGKQYGNFASMGIAWIFSEEKWFRNFLPIISFGKVRGSYGTTGSDAVGDYQFLTRWSSNGSSGQPYSGSQPLFPQQHANPNYHWQVNRKLEGAIDLGFLKDQVNLSVAFYRNRCGNQLVSFPTPAFSGFTTVTANSPALVQNSGLEFTTSAGVVNSKNFSLSISINGGINRNKLIEYPNIEQSPYASSLIVGKSLNIVHLLHYTGVDPKTGEYSFEDKKHDGQITYNPPDDDTYLKDLSPTFLGGMGLDFRYKSIQLNLFFDIRKQIGLNALYSTVGTAGQLGNQPLELVGKVWMNPGDFSSYAKYTMTPSTSYAYFRGSDAAYTDASFVRLSNLSLSYSLPTSSVKRLGMKECRIFFHTNNLFVITKYKGIDPETQNFGSMPISKSIVGGINFNF